MKKRPEMNAKMRCEYLKSALARYMRECPESKFGHNNNDIPLGLGMTQLEGSTYYALVRMIRPKTIVEAGANRGNSAWFMLQALKANLKQYKVTGLLHTIDDVDYNESFIAKDSSHVRTHFEEDILEWIEKNEYIMEECDIFHHDDAHVFDHINKEIEMVVERGNPKVIVIHDIQTESKAYWDNWRDNLAYLPNYDRFEVISLMGVGIFIRKDIVETL